MNVFAKISVVLGLLVIALGAFLAGQVNAPEPVLGGVSQGTQGDIASTSVWTVTSTAGLITRGESATSTCSARILSTKTAPITLAFATTSIAADNQYFPAPAGSISGIIQGASTTVVYDSQFYGCGAIQAYSQGGTTNVTYISTK